MDDIIPVLVGGVVALAGALIGPFFQRRHEHWKASREDAQVLRDKAAEIFSEMDRIAMESHQASIAVIKNLIEENGVPSPLPDLGKVRMLVAVYFPSLKGLVDSYESRVRELEKELAQEISKANQSYDVAAFKRATAIIVQKRNQQAFEFVKSIRSEITNKLPRLK